MSASDSQRLKELYEFGPFRVDPEKEVLLRTGQPVPLTPKTFQVLLVLVRHHQEVVTKDDLMKAVWPDTYVEEANLSRNIFMLRKALGESPQDHQYILTVPGRGYRFAENVRLVPEQEVSIVAAQHSKVQVQVKETKPWAWLSAAVILLLAIAGGAMWLLLQRKPVLTEKVPQIRSLAVLPLTNMSGDPEQEYFSDGLTDALITNLSKIGFLRIISRTSVMQYKGAHRKLPEIAKELNVDGVVEGSVMRSGNRVRIDAQLIHAPTDRHLWAESYEGDLSDVLKLQSEVAQAIAHQVRAQLTPQQQVGLSFARAVNPAAYEAYLKGRFYQNTNFSTPQGIKNAQRYFEDATQQDPGFAQGYVGLAYSYITLGLFRWVAPQDAYQPAKEALNRASQLDETLGEAHSVFGVLSWRYEWDWSTAKREFNHALELSPNDPHGHAEFALYLGWVGLRNEALAEVAKIHELSPGVPGWSLNIESAIYYQLRDYKAMVEAGRQSVPLNPGSWLRHYFLAVGYEGSGQIAEAIPEYQKAVELSQGDQDSTAALAHAYATLGRRAETEKILGECERQSQTSYVSPYMIATVYASLGEKNKAFEYLEKAYEEKSSDLPYFLKSDLRIDNLRSDPRFQDLVRRMNFPK